MSLVSLITRANRHAGAATLDGRIAFSKQFKGPFDHLFDALVAVVSNDMIASGTVRITLFGWRIKHFAKFEFFGFKKESLSSCFCRRCYGSRMEDGHGHNFDPDYSSPRRRIIDPNSQPR